MTPQDKELFDILDRRNPLSVGDRVARIKTLVAAGANVNARAEYDMTPLHLATMSPLAPTMPPPEYDVVACLLDLGAEIDARNDAGFTPLMRAFSYNDSDAPGTIEWSVDVAEYLVERGASIHARDKEGRGLAHLLSCAGAPVWECLIRLGVDIRSADDDGNTPLHHVVHSERPALVALLVEQPIDLNAVNKRNKTPLGLALKAHEHSPSQKSNKAKIIQLLQDRGAVKSPPPGKASPHAAAVDADQLLAAVKAADLDKKAADFLSRPFDSYEELVDDMRLGLHSDHYVNAVNVCRTAIGGDGTTLRRSGEQHFEAPFFHHGDLVIEGNVSIRRPFAVTGSLTVRGCIRDCGPDSIVVVGRDVNVHSLHTSGEFHVGGDIHAEGVVYGYYNDNVLSANTIRARLVIEDEHATYAEVVSPHHFDSDTYQQGQGEGVVERLRAILVEDVFVPEGDDDAGELDRGRLFDRLMKGESVFR